MRRTYKHAVLSGLVQATGSSEAGGAGAIRTFSGESADAQKRVAEETIADVDASHLWPGKVVTKISPAGDFWEAESEHQDYLEHYPGGYTCHYVRPDWTLPRAR